MEKVKEYYLGGNFNCAESVLRAANDEYGLGLDEKALVSIVIPEPEEEPAEEEAAEEESEENE